MTESRAEIICYGTRCCLDCWRVQRLLDQYQAPYKWIDIDRDPEARAYVQQINGGYRSVPTIGFWTRTMSDGTAQIFRFTVTTDQGETFGPFDLPDTDRIYAFPVQFTARKLRFDAVQTSSGNTGTVEIEVYGIPHEP